METGEYATNKGGNAIKAGLTGAAIGALGVAAAYALTDRETRNKVNDKIDEVKDKSKQKMDEVKSKARQMRHVAQDEAEDLQQDAEELAS